MNVPLLAAMTRARRRDNSLFARWCELSGIASCPAAPAAVAKFVTDCGSLGIERLWPAVQEISSTHVSFGLADPTLGGAAAAAIRRSRRHRSAARLARRTQIALQVAT